MKYPSDISTFMNSYAEENSFSGYVFIAQNNKLLYEDGFGFANYESETEHTSQTTYRLASLTKQFTAFSILLLEERGLLNLHDPISKYFPNYAEGAEITIHHLLSMSSGIPELNFYNPNGLLDSLEEGLVHEFDPGEKFSYSNSNYLLLEYIIKQVSGLTYDEFLQKNILEPAEMFNTGTGDPASNLALGYPNVSDRINREIKYTLDPPYSYGGMYSTMEDLYKWDQILYTEKLAKQATINKMYTSYNDSYGYGWFVDGSIVKHSGIVSGYSPYILRDIEQNLVLILLSNIDGLYMEMENLAYELLKVVND
ncbi:serine hydrolase domain-containing protein [Chengkuizengella axinellae]|uniref:Serine hydrolase domain-containing protein n=1 Tax=Chengkuizengella axinellae TaxID=3064388 RepID=A0ABT9IZ10_9BACL|nr:serine hydrolase domain-containing protein [Chengkuizengella sp. 2205SS18-9]MDP5274609.1 serine hydrolase domain-containing protein [Chengkuizengella sp. 2205SS18-9]